MSGYSIKCSNDNTLKNTNLKAFYAVKYCVNYCIYPFNGNISTHILDNILTEIKTEDSNSLVLLYHNGAHDLPQEGDLIFSDNNYLAVAGNLRDLFDFEINDFNQILIVNNTLTDISFLPFSIDFSFGYLSNISCSNAPSLILSFVDITTTDINIYNVNDWNTFFADRGNDVNFTNVFVYGNTVYLSGNLDTIDSLYLSNIHIDYINVDAVSHLSLLDVSYNSNFKSIDIQNTHITTFICVGSGLTSCSLPPLENLNVTKNNLTTLPIFNTDNLKYLNIVKNLIEGTFVLDAPILVSLNCSANSGMTSLQVTGSNLLENISAEWNNISEIAFNNDIFNSNLVISLMNNNIQLDQMTSLLQQVIDNSYQIKEIHLEGGLNVSTFGHEDLTSMYIDIENQIGDSITMNHT